MAENDTSQEKTEEPTERRLSEARQKGQVPRSRELNTLLSLLGASIAMIFLGQILVTRLAEMMRQSISFESDRFKLGVQMYEQIQVEIGFALLTVIPLMIILTIVSFAGPISMGGWTFSAESLQPKLDKLDPIKGLKRMFGLQSLVELLKAVLKFLLVGVAAVIILFYQADTLTHLGAMTYAVALATFGEVAVWSFLGFCSVMILVACVDVPYQLWSFKSQMKMTRQEVKDEMKDSEGRPEIKSKIKSLQRRMSEGRMMNAVPDADVIITNPTHYAVAIKYDQNGLGAPRLVAKGRDHLALRIREIAEENAVHIFEAPPLARALFAAVEVNHEIPAGLYRSVAKVLAYVYQLNERRRPVPIKISDLDIPEHLRSEAP